MIDPADEVARLFRAIESRDLRILRDASNEGVSWRNVPEPPAVGQRALCRLIGLVTLPAERVSWEVTRLAVSDGVAHVERLDRFLIDGAWYEVWCHGVVIFDDLGRLLALDDYVDLAEWRSRIGPVLGRVASRSPAQVIASMRDRLGSPWDQLASVLHPDVVLDLPDAKDRFEGWCSVADVIDGDGPIDADVFVGRVEPRTLEVRDEGWRCVSSDSSGREVAVSVGLTGGRVGSISVEAC